MASGCVTTDGAPGLSRLVLDTAARHWIVLTAALLFAASPFLELVRREWSREQGAAGPMILASGLWLLFREGRGLRVIQGGTCIALALATPLLGGFIFANVVGLFWLEWVCTYGVLLVVLYACVGGRVMARLWFPLGYLLFLTPPPFGLIDPITRTRKLWLSVTSADILAAMGFETAYNGTTLYIDQYELMIADACAGMNSQFSLIAIGLFYVYVVRRAEWRYAIVLALLSLPIAMIANLTRILLLMLGIDYLGANAAEPEGILHQTAGLVMFLASIICLIGLDAALTPIRHWLARR